LFESEEGKIMAHIRYCALMVLAVGLGFSPASAWASIDINFEGDTPGSAPGVNLVPGNPMTQPSAIGGYDPNYASPPSAASGTIVVGNPSGGSNEAVLTSVPTNGELGALWVDVNGFNLSAQQVQMSFDVNILDAPTTATAQPKALSTGGTAGILLGMNTFVTSPDFVGVLPSFRFAAAPTSATGGVFAFRSPDNSTLIPFFNYTEGEQHYVSIIADYSTGTLDAFVDGVLSLPGFAFWTSGASAVTTSEYFFHLNGELGNANQVALDNIASAALPEPSMLMVWSLLGAAAIGAAWQAKPRAAR
jgi:hypothetical protein